jgi:ubiquitin-protein ligase E3 D
VSESDFRFLASAHTLTALCPLQVHHRPLTRPGQSLGVALGTQGPSLATQCRYLSRTEAMPNPKIVLYAEALVHIRQLTLHASLQTEKNEHTRILLSSDKTIITALHDGESSSIYLPTQISGTANVTFPTDRRTEISTRLQIDDAEQRDPALDHLSDVEVPWAAASLQENSAISCRHCDTCLLPASTAVAWKDLPSEHWADLMDFWFCHKPHTEHDAAQIVAAETKGYGAKSKISADAGVGLVDPVSLLLNKNDCTNIEVSQLRAVSRHNLLCPGTGAKKEAIQVLEPQIL